MHIRSTPDSIEIELTKTERSHLVKAADTLLLLAKHYGGPEELAVGAAILPVVIRWGGDLVPERLLKLYADLQAKEASDAKK